MMPGSPRFLDLVTVWCLAFEILTRTAIEMPAAMLRELEPPVAATSRNFRGVEPPPTSAPRNASSSRAATLEGTDR